jgi:hypothetical protein
MLLLRMGNVLTFLSLFAVIGLLLYFLSLSDLKLRRRHIAGLILLMSVTLILGLIKSPYSDSLESTNWAYIEKAFILKHEGIASDAGGDRSSGYPALLSLLLRSSEDYRTIFIMNILISCTNVALFFFLLRELFLDDNLAIFGSFVYALDYNIFTHSQLTQMPCISFL